MIALLLATSCAIFRQPTLTPVQQCYGSSLFATAGGLAAQTGDQGFPEIEVDLRECIQVELADTCLEEARLAWLVGVVGAAKDAAAREEAYFLIPAVSTDECDP